MLSFNVEKLTKEQLKQLINSADDNFDNQIRVTKDGYVFISRTVGAVAIEDLQFRYETWDAGNDFVGPTAACDEQYIDDLFNSIKSDWNKKRNGYIDF